MKLSASYSFPASRERVFSALIDPSVLQQCVPGVERLTKTGETSYDAELSIGFAGLKGRYTGTARLADQKPSESFTLMVDGKGSSGFVKGVARIALAAHGIETEMRCDADVQVGGVIAAVGSRLIEAAARKMMDDFFRCFSRQLQETG